MKVAKFGGSSVKDTKAMRRCCQIVFDDPEVSVVVVSATKNTTNEIELIAASAKDGYENEALNYLSDLKERHLSILKDCSPSDLESTFFNDLFLEFKQSIQIRAKAKNLSKENMDELYAYGERISSFLFSLLLKKSIQREVILKDARQLIKTNSDFCEAKADIALIKDCCEKNLTKDLEAKRVIVTQGFIGTDKLDRTTTLGREGSDYTATLISEAINAREVQIWTDVNGIATTDPRLIDGTRFIKELSYEEASTLALLGAKVLYPKTLFPALRKEIPVFVGSSLNPTGGGTLIHGNCQLKKGPRALSLLKKNKGTLLSLVGREMKHIKVPLEKSGESSYSLSFLVDDDQLASSVKELHDIVLDHFD